MSSAVSPGSKAKGMRSSSGSVHLPPRMSQAFDAACMYLYVCSLSTGYMIRFARRLAAELAPIGRLNLPPAPRSRVLRSASPCPSAGLPRRLRAPRLAARGHPLRRERSLGLLPREVRALDAVVLRREARLDRAPGTQVFEEAADEPRVRRRLAPAEQLFDDRSEPLVTGR